tara:strand:+ start:164 stop:352 length:189 start_codon:yes stop_codon:yes gene_type:complete
MKSNNEGCFWCKERKAYFSWKNFIQYYDDKKPKIKEKSFLNDCLIRIKDCLNTLHQKRTKND